MPCAHRIRLMMLYSLSPADTSSLSEVTFFLPKTHSLSRRHTLSRRHILSLSRRHILSPEDTVLLPKRHSLSRRHTLSPEDTFSLPKTHAFSRRHMWGGLAGTCVPRPPNKNLKIKKSPQNSKDRTEFALFTRHSSPRAWWKSALTVTYKPISICKKWKFEKESNIYDIWWQWSQSIHHGVHRVIHRCKRNTICEWMPAL